MYVHVHSSSSDLQMLYELCYFYDLIYHIHTFLQFSVLLLEALFSANYISLISCYLPWIEIFSLCVRISQLISLIKSYAFLLSFRLEDKDYADRQNADK